MPPANDIGKNAELVIFDLDGTLIDSRADIANAVNAALAHLGQPGKSLDEVMGMIGGGTRSLMEQALHMVHDRKQFDDAFAVFTKHYNDHLLDNTRFYPGVEETLDRMDGVPMAVISNKRQRFCDAILEGLGARGRFKKIMGGDALSEKKPHPAPLLHMCNALDIPPRKTVMVGDSPVDVNAGKAAGTFTIGIMEGFTLPEVMTSSGADILIASVAKIPPDFGVKREPPPQS